MCEGKTRALNAQPLWVSLWFVLDAIVALVPPLHWIDAGSTPIVGLPAAIFYFVAVGICICASIIAAFLAETASGRDER